MANTFDHSQARALLDRVRAADGRAPDGPPDAEAVTVHARHDDAGTLIALAWRQRDGEAGELYVDPAHRGQGIGRQLATALLADGRAETATGTGDGRAETATGIGDGRAGHGGRPGIWAHGTLPAARHLAERLGLTAQRELLQLRAALPAAAAADDPIPDGARIRTFEPGADDGEFLRVNAAAFAWHPEQGRLSKSDLDASMAEPWFDPSGFFLAVAADDPDHVLGFHWTKVHPAQPPAEPEALGEIYVLGVDPASPVRRLGGPLTAAGLRYLASLGLGTVLLYVEADNERAVRLYRRYGFVDHAVDTVFG